MSLTETVHQGAKVTAAQTASDLGFAVEKVRQDFPALHQEVRGKPLAYLDNAASAQTPQCVIDALVDVYARNYSNIHRGVHTLSARATKMYDDVRRKAKHFVNAASEKEIIFLRGTTEAINLVASSYGGANIKAGDEILITGMEHHSNIVPWQLLCERTGAKLKVVPLNDDGAFSIETFAAQLTDKTKFVSVVHISNALGTINPVKEIIALAHERGIPVLLDGAQAAPHVTVDVQDLDCDFYALSGHKLFGPTGVGLLYGKAELLEAMPPYQGGGDMISTVSFEKSTYAPVPAKFEAGTPNIAGVIGLGAAFDYLQALDMNKVAAYEASLLAYATKALCTLPQVRLIGTAPQKAGVLGFVIEGVRLHPHDLGTILDTEGVAIRAGHHCAEPVMTHFGVPATARASFAFYNTTAEADALVTAVAKAIDLFS